MSGGRGSRGTSYTCSKCLCLYMHVLFGMQVSAGAGPHRPAAHGAYQQVPGRVRQVGCHVSRVTLLRVLCRWGNRLTRSYLNVRHLLEPEQATRGNRRQRRSALSTCCFRDNINSFVTPLVTRVQRGAWRAAPAASAAAAAARGPEAAQLRGRGDADREL